MQGDSKWVRGALMVGLSSLGCCWLVMVLVLWLVSYGAGVGAGGGDGSLYVAFSRHYQHSSVLSWLHLRVSQQPFAAWQ